MTAGPVRVVFDKNVLVSGHFWKGSPYRCLLAVEAGLAVMVLSDPILAELDEKLTVKFGVSKAEVDSIVKRLRTGAERRAAWCWRHLTNRVDRRRRDVRADRSKNGGHDEPRQG